MPIGVDVSKWNVSSDGKTMWNPDKALKPIDFVIQRVSYGGSSGSQVKDELLEPMYAQVIKVPVRGAYHYYSSHSSWKTQADFFLNIVKSKDYHFYAIDYETAYNVLDRRTIAEFAQFVDYIKAQTGKHALAYLNWNVFETFIKPFGYTSWVNEQDVWYAWYPYQTTEDPRPLPTLPNGLTRWKIWQYGAGDVTGTAGVNAGANYGGGSRGIDLNTYNGTMDDMNKWLNLELLPKPEVSDAEKLSRLWKAHPELW